MFGRYSSEIAFSDFYILSSAFFCPPPSCCPTEEEAIGRKAELDIEAAFTKLNGKPLLAAVTLFLTNCKSN